MRNRTIIYPGTFDPIHNGHIDLIKRISKQFDLVIVAIANDTGDKQPSSSFEDRIKYATKAIEELKLNNIEIEGFKGKAVDFAVKKNAAILRGVRNENDFKSEAIFSRVNRALKPVEVFLLVSDPAYDEISSTKVRMKIKNKNEIYDLVPDSVVKTLKTTDIDHQHLTGNSINWKYKLSENAITFWQKNRSFIRGAICGVVLTSLVNRFIL